MLCMTCGRKNTKNILKLKSSNLGKEKTKMAIGILSLTVGAIFLAVGFAGISTVEPPKSNRKETAYPYPTELKKEVFLR